jgi:hypothetical protein
LSKEILKLKRPPVTAEAFEDSIKPTTVYVGPVSEGMHGVATPTLGVVPGS